jgi:hypothetical protein
MRVVALNRAGLIYWALNDTDAALRNFNEALDLAAGGLDLGEVASTTITGVWSIARWSDGTRRWRISRRRSNWTSGRRTHGGSDTRRGTRA